MKLPVPQPGSRMVARCRDAQAGDRLVDGGDDGRRRVEGVEGGALGAVVFLRREQRLQLLAERLPAGILVSAGDRIGEDRQGDRAEAGEAGERLPFLRRGRPLLLLDALQRADGGEDVAGLGFLAAGDKRVRYRVRAGPDRSINWRQFLAGFGSTNRLLGIGGTYIGGPSGRRFVRTLRQVVEQRTMRVGRPLARCLQSRGGF